MSRMKKRPVSYALLGIVVVAAVALVYTYSSPPTSEMAVSSPSTRETTVANLINETHIHGIAVDTKDASRLYVATHHGLFVVNGGEF